ncbi:IS110 family transposase [Epibacterium mobile]|nr:IS110 family transposase [Tritonibacter mobilis]
MRASSQPKDKPSWKTESAPDHRRLRGRSALRPPRSSALTGFAPIVHDGGVMRGKRAIGAGRRLLRHVMFQAALIASHHNPILKSFAPQENRTRPSSRPLHEHSSQSSTRSSNRNKNGRLRAHEKYSC